MKISKHFCLRVTLFLFIILTIKTSAQLFLPKVDYAAGTQPYSVAIGDFNGDNKSDLAVANDDNNNVSTFLGNGDGTFQNKVDYITGTSPRSVAIGDFNGDNNSDLAVANWSSNNVSILLGNGDGTFQNKVDYAAGANPRSIAIGDFNGDNKSDLAVANFSSTTVSILLGNGDGTFQNKVDYAAGSNPESVAIGDFNVDNKSDLAVANDDNNNVSILLGNGDGTFQNKVDYATGTSPYSVATGDFNVDNKSDLAVANNVSNNVSILLGNGDGTFQNKVDYAAGSHPVSVAIGDFNVDNKSDLAVANNGGKNVSILIHTNNLPTAANGSVTINEDNIKTFATDEFNYTDADGDPLSKIQITSLPVSGTLFKDDNLNSTADAGETILLNGEVTKAEIDANKLKFMPGLNENGTPYTTYDFKVHDGTAYSSNSYTTTINVTAVNDAPELAVIEVAVLSYTEGEAATEITSTIEVTDIDDANIESANIQITMNYSNGEDILSFTNQNGIRGTWTAATGTMALSGRATLANYQTALRDVKYNNTSNALNTSVRTVSFTVNDGDVNSNTSTRQINIIATNNAPVLRAIEVAALSYTEGDTATAVTSTITVSDVDDTNIESATVQITGNYQNGKDVLSFTNQNEITGTWTAATGTMALSGSATLANYQTALRDVKYSNTSQNPSTLERTVSFTVNDGDENSNTLTKQINITAVNNAPVLASTEVAILIYTEGDAATAITSTINVSDVDDTNIESATIQIMENYQNGQDVLSFTNQNGITCTWTTATGTMALSGSATLANYQTALRGVKYSNTSQNPSTLERTVSFTINDGDNNSNTLTRQISVEGSVTDISTLNNEIPGEYALYSNYPNPFNPSTIIRYALPKESYVSLNVYNILGEEVFKLTDGINSAGYHEIEFDANKLSSGIYIYRIRAGEFIQTKKMILMK